MDPLVEAFWHELLRRRAKAIPVRLGYAIRFLMDKIFFKSLEKMSKRLAGRLDGL